MDPLEFYRKLTSIVCEDQAIYGGDMPAPSLAELISGQVGSGPVSLGALLPQLCEDELKCVLSSFAASQQKVIALVSIYYSDEVSASGLNLHRTVQPLEWWKALFESSFPQVDFVKSRRDSELVCVNFRLSDVAKSKIAKLGETSSMQREFSRLTSRVALGWRLLARNCVNRDALFAALEGRTVAVVGNARSLAQAELGADIDAHDLVIRFNRVPIISRRSHGYRTSWVATGVPISQSRLSSLGGSHVLWLSRYRRKIPGETTAIQNLYLHPVSEIDSLAERSKVMRPTTGLTAIDLLSKSKAQKVSLFGFDFYQSQSSSSHQTIENAPHQFDNEENFVRALIARDPRFEIR